MMRRNFLKGLLAAPVVAKATAQKAAEHLASKELMGGLASKAGRVWVGSGEDFEELTPGYGPQSNPGKIAAFIARMAGGLPQWKHDEIAEEERNALRIDRRYIGCHYMSPQVKLWLSRADAINRRTNVKDIARVAAAQELRRKAHEEWGVWW